MEKGVRVEFGRGRFVIMAIALLTGFASLSLLCMAYFNLKAPKVLISHIAMLVVIAAFLFAASLLCFISLLLRYMSIAALRVSTRHEPTEYVNAWQAAADRMALDEDLPHEPGEDDVLLEIDDEDDEDDDQEEDTWR